MSHGHVPGPRCIVLVGFMAAGKSTVGRILADRLGWEFMDLDERIRKRTGRPPGTLIRERGEAAFRALEAELTAELADWPRLVLAPGGGWGERPEGAAALAAALGPGTVRVWLRVSAVEAVRRAAGDPVDRPLLGQSDDHAERVRLAESLLRARAPLYATAELVVDTDGNEPAAIVDAIMERLGLDQ